MSTDTPFIQTVKGPIAPESLGQTLMHEHLTADWPYALGQAKTREETVPVIERTLEVLERTHAAGINAFVDVGTELFGPSPLFLLCIAAQTPVHIVCSTGCFASDMLPPPGWTYSPNGPEEIAEHFVRAATHGLEGSGVKPGVIKIATSGQTITDLEKRVFGAAAIAQQRTGLAITTHTFATAWALEQVDVLEEAGADLDRVVIGHIGWGSTPDDRELHRGLAERGVVLGLDCVSQPCLSIDGYADIAADLVEQGHADKIVFSHDTAAYPRGLYEIFGPDWLKGEFTYVSNELIPALRERGVDQAAINQIMVETPKRILSVDPGRYPGAKDTLLATLTADPFAQYDYSWPAAGR
jgi:phosphotriesterase-related protein